MAATFTGSSVNQEGFLCPVCVRDLGSAKALSDHFQQAHSEDSNDVLDQFKGFLGKAKKFFNLEQDGLLSADASQPIEHRSRTSSTQLSRSSFHEPQELGKIRRHTDYFKSIRDSAVDRSVIESNKIIIRLSKLTSDEVPEDGPKRRAFEQKIVPWEEDRYAKTCKGCGRSFNLTRRRHHCRLCGGIMCDRCSEFLPISQAKLVGLSASSDSGLAVSKAQPMFLRRRGSDSSLSSMGNGETGPALRMCSGCRKLLESHQRKQEQKYSKPDLVLLYEKIQENKKRSEDLVSEYSRMALSLQTGETIYSLDKASALRGQIAQLYNNMEAVSKRIMNLGNQDKEPSSKQLSLQLSIRARTVAYIQERSAELPKLPDDKEFQAILSQREQQRRKRLEQELRESQRQQQQQQQQLKAEAAPQIRQPAGPLKNVDTARSSKPSGQGWKPGEVDTRLVEDSDPMVQQMNIIRGYLKQARQAQKWDEVEMLEENLRTLEREHLSNG